MIVRVMGEGQWRIDDDGLVQRLNELDDRIGAAVEAGDEETMRSLLRELGQAVKDGGEKLPDEELSPSEAIVPPDDLSLEEARELLSGEGLIPDLPTEPGNYRTLWKMADADGRLLYPAAPGVWCQVLAVY